MIFDTWYTLDPGADVCTMTCPKTGTGTAGSGRSESHPVPDGAQRVRTMIFDTWYTLDPGADVCTMTCPKTGTGTAGSGRSESRDAKETAGETQSGAGPVPAASAQSTDSPASPKEAGVEARPVQVSIRSLPCIPERSRRRSPSGAGVHPVAGRGRCLRADLAGRRCHEAPVRRTAGLQGVAAL